MPYSVFSQADSAPRRSPSPSPAGVSRHGELIAVLAVAALAAHLLLAQLTLVLAVAMYATDRISRWRPQWLIVPVAAGLLAALALGAPRAVDGLTAGPRQVLSYLGGIGGHPGHLLRPQGAFAGLAHWLPEQLPLALVIAAAEVYGVCWAQRRLGAERPWRAGLIVAARRRVTASSLRSGGVVTRDGCCVGLDLVTGRPAAISWREAEEGVLCAGTDPTGTGFMLAHAAIRRRKPVIVIDLTGSAWLAASLAAACAEPGAPLLQFGQHGPGYYEPLRGGDPARAAALVMSMIDWAGVADRQRRSCAAYITDALAVQSAAGGDRRVPVLDDLIGLLVPDGLRDRAVQIPGYHPRRDVLNDRARVSAGLLEADPATVATPVAQLLRLRASALGRWLQPGPPGSPQISLGRTVRERAVTLFSLDRGALGQAAQMIAGLAVADMLAVCAELGGMSVPGDGLVWVNGCEALGHQALADLITRGRGSGMAVVLGTTSDEAADGMVTDVGVLVARGPVDPALVGAFAGTGAGPASSGQAGAAPDAAADLIRAGRAGAAADVPFGLPDGGLPVVARQAGADAFALLAKGPRHRALPNCRHVPAQVGGRPEAGGQAS